MKNSFTVDVEDWFCSHNLQGQISFNQWHQLESRVVRNTDALLELLDRYNVKATFFVLGWVAEKFPALVRDIASMGHEIGSHGYAHQLVTQLNRDSFREDVQLSIDAIYAASGIMPVGYRAPAFSITPRTLWALPLLQQLGMKYDSSVYPFAYHPDYGLPNAPLERYEIIPGLQEIPMSCSMQWGVRIPCSGGAYLRFFPYGMFRKLVKKVTAERPFIFYIHPWELDSQSPRIALPFLKSARHYANLGTTQKKLERLLQEFEFTSMQNMLQSRNAYDRSNNA
jgi:polysaccharide deacetylase family protein (PEP-CTERM system associated)